jgi:hypothetical protein
MNSEKQKKAAAEIGRMNSKQVYCKELNYKFSSTREVERLLKIPNANISQCCRGIRKSAGKHPVTKEKLTWKYLPEKY